MRTIPDIIAAAGGPSAIAAASGGTIKSDAVRKWSKIGIPDRHWRLLIDRAGSNPSELFAANEHVRCEASREVPAR